MTESFSVLFDEYLQVWSSPDSFVKEKPVDDENEDENTKDIQEYLSKISKSMKNKDSIDDDDITDITDTIKNIIMNSNFDDKNIDCSGLNKYVQEYLTLIKTSEQTGVCCTHFINNFESYNDEYEKDVIPAEILFRSMSCQSCGLLYSAHNVCQKYFLTVRPERWEEEGPCDTCGMDKYIHNVCDKFMANSTNTDDMCTTCGHKSLNIDKICTTCGQNLFAHQQKEMDNGNYPCKNFKKPDAPNSIFECNYCIHNKDKHLINQQIFKMNEEASDKITILSTKISYAYANFQDVDKEKYMYMYTKFLTMNLSPQHRDYNKYICILDALDICKNRKFYI